MAMKAGKRKPRRKKPVEKVEKPREKIVPAVPDTEKTMDAARIATLNALDSWNRAFAARDRSIEQFYDRKITIVSYGCRTAFPLARQ